MTMLMKAGTMGLTSDTTKFLGGLGTGSISENQMSKFKKILANITKSENSFSGQFIRDILNKSEKVESDDISVSSELIHFLYNKADSGEEVEVETGLLEGLMQQFVHHSLETGGPIAFEVESESHGKISIKFEPKNKKLSIESEISRELVANTGFMNIFSDLDIEKIEFVDSKKLSALQPASSSLDGVTARNGSSKLVAYKGIINNFSEIDDKVKSNSFFFKKKKDESAVSNQNSIAQKTGETENLGFLDKPAPSGKKQPLENVNLSGEAIPQKTVNISDKAELPSKTGFLDNFSKKSTLPGQINVASLVGKAVNSEMSEGIHGKQKTTSEVVKTPKMQKGLSDAVISSIKPENAEKNKISQSQAVEAIKNTVAQSKLVFKGKSAGKFQVTMEVAEKGALTVSSQKNENAVETNIQVETPNARDWLKSALAKKGVKVDNISVQIKSDSPETKKEIVEKAGTFGKLISDTEKTPFAINKVSGMVRTVLKKIAAVDSSEIPVKEKETLSANFEKLEVKINQSVLNGSKVDHAIKAESEQTFKWLEKELGPIADEIVKQKLPVSKLTVVKEESIKFSLKPEVAAINQEPPDIKSNSKNAKQQAAVSSINLINADKSSGDEESFSGESQFSKNDFQVKESLTTKGVQSTEFKIPVEPRGDGSQVVNISTATGQVQFDVVNGKLVSAQKVDSSHMPEMIQKIAELAHNQANLSSRKLEVQMDMKDMGKVMVDALRRADSVNLQIQVESTEVRRILETQLKPFIEQMAKDGIDIGKLDVSVRDEKQESQTAEHFSENAFQNHEEKQASENFRDFFTGFESEKEIRGDFERKQVRPKVTGNQTLEIWA